MTRIRPLFVFVLLAVFATAASAQAPAAKPAAKKDLGATIEKLERAGWEAFKKRDDKAFAALCAPEYTAVVADQKPPRDVQATTQSAHSVTIHKYSLSDVKVTALGPTAALITYIASLNVAFGEGQPQDVQLAVTSLWVKRAGHWKGVRYHESEIK